MLIIEDHVMVAEALGAAMAEADGLDVVGVGTNFADAEGWVLTRPPDVVILDFTLPDVETADAVARFKIAAPQTRVVVLSAVSDYRSVVRTLEAGADGFILKSQALRDLVEAVRTVHAGGRALAPQLVSTLLDRLTPAANAGARLSRREVEVLSHLAQGASTAELSTLLGVSVHTVRNHVQSAIRRLGAHSKMEAVAIAQRQGIISSNGLASTS